MNSVLAGILLRRARRSLLENFALNLASAGVIAVALVLIGSVLMVLANGRAVMSSWSQDVHISAYFDYETESTRQAALAKELAERPEVVDVVWVTTEDASIWLAGSIPEVAPALEELGDDVLPASLELSLATNSPEEIAAFVTSIEDGPWLMIDYGQEWVERFHSTLSLVEELGAALATVILAAALYMVVNTMHLIIFTRKSELEIMKLVGATWLFMTIPFFLEGLVQGLLGAGIAIAIMWGMWSLLSHQLAEIFQIVLGAEPALFLPTNWIVGLVCTGMALGVGGCLLSIRRFWKAAT